MTSKEMEVMLDAVYDNFREVRATIMGEWEDGDEVIFLDGGKDLSDNYYYNIEHENGVYSTSIQEAEELDPVKSGKHKTVKGVINFIKKWNAENGE